jgi:hypothetical protein
VAPFVFNRAFDAPVDRSRDQLACSGQGDDELELDREMEYLVEPEEAEARGITEVE